MYVYLPGTKTFRGTQGEQKVDNASEAEGRRATEADHPSKGWQEQTKKSSIEVCACFMCDIWHNRSCACAYNLRAIWQKFTETCQTRYLALDEDTRTMAGHLVAYSIVLA